jgi:hypothetical protein
MKSSGNYGFIDICIYKNIAFATRFSACVQAMPRRFPFEKDRE